MENSYCPPKNWKEDFEELVGLGNAAKAVMQSVDIRYESMLKSGKTGITKKQIAKEIMSELEKETKDVSGFAKRKIRNFILSIYDTA